MLMSERAYRCGYLGGYYAAIKAMRFLVGDLDRPLSDAYHQLIDYVHGPLSEWSLRDNADESSDAPFVKEHPELYPAKV